jgi:exodeoxyribonuclease V beta subunit
VLDVPLGEPGAPFTLAAIPKEERLNELEFYYPVEQLSPKVLQEIFSHHVARGGRKAPEGNGGGRLLPHDWLESWPDQLAKLGFHTVRGYMKGYIDLVFRFRGRFYLVDWKSNHLGNAITDYRSDALAACMMRDTYLLQYHLYAVALDRYLQLRLPGYRYADHFGEIYYIFLRGVDPDQGAHYGVFRDRPREELIRALSEGFGGKQCKWNPQ